MTAEPLSPGRAQAARWRPVVRLLSWGGLGMLVAAAAFTAAGALWSDGGDGGGGGAGIRAAGTLNGAEAAREYELAMEIISEEGTLVEYERAARHLERALELDAGLNEARFRLALVYEAVGRLGDAEDMLLKLRSRRPGFPGLDATLRRVRSEQLDPGELPRGGHI